MKRGNLLRAVVFFFLIIVISAQAFAESPTESIRETTDKIIAFVADPALNVPDRAGERKRLIRQAVDERFDWVEMARRTLARHWARRTDEERKEFIALFGRLLETTYLDKVDGYSGEEVLYEGESVDEVYGVVKVKIVTKNETEIPVEYRVKKRGDDWFVYDISIEGVSLINNYRTQFNSIIVRSSYENLVKKLRVKVEED
ncbi:MAG: ABC transporter substrate-binding protein [Thermodesulfobacteriota bacterium]|nr:ABC transporter substrate-binding protein [Thermodesulfobacteriota bacterium]